jgi:plastocyanin
VRDAKLEHVVHRAALVAVILVLLSTGSASAATTTVTLSNYAFTPANQVVALGGSVVWRNASARKHTVTPSAAWAWGSLTVKPGRTSSAVTLTQAGSYPYHCAIHPRRMRGTITVPMTASPMTGTTATFFTLTLGTVEAPGMLMHEVWARQDGGAWSLRVSTSAPSISLFFPSPGAWDLRTRLSYLLGGSTSDWTAVVTLAVS